jgi:transcription-repair coupling factor (superfamily II helicase)
VKPPAIGGWQSLPPAGTESTNEASRSDALQVSCTTELAYNAAKMKTDTAIGRLLAEPELVELARACAKHKNIAASGLWGSSVAAVVAAVRREAKRPVMVICGHIDEADDLADDIELFLRSLDKDAQRPSVMQAVETGGGLGRASEEQVADRLKLIARIAGAKKNAQPDLIASIQSLMQSVPTRDELKWLTYTLAPGQQLEPEKLIVWLSEHGYNRLDQVEVPGDFAVRGGIIDIYLPGVQPDTGELGFAIRVDFFGDQVESIRMFDVSTLGSGDKLQQQTIYDIAGKPPTSSTSLFNLLADDTILIWWAPLEIAEQAKSYMDRVNDQRGMYPLSAVLRSAQHLTTIELSQFEQAANSPSLLVDHPGFAAKLPVGSVQKFETDVKKSMAELAETAATHDIAIYCESDAEMTRFIELLDQHQPGLKEKIELAKGYLHRGFVWSSGGFNPSSEAEVVARPRGSRPALLLGHHELFHRFEVRRRVKRSVTAKAIDSFLDLQVGDFVVHVAHGIAKFTGIHSVTKDGKTEEYLTLRFAESASLHVPANRINLVQKYIGGFSGHPTLSRLGSGSWEKQKEKVSEAVMDMAAELIDVQAARRAQPGVAYPPDTPWQLEFEAEFPYSPTPDQLTGSTEIKGDMQQPRPMDRLLCGDVGYGKTELAMRAAFKAVEYGKQVAVLVPTTILAEQHEQSFKARFREYPFRIASISRFKTGKEGREIMKATQAGEIDILIGTHRILSKDVQFADLGLVVIDEEQRFGVKHKEDLKKFRATVDVLTMSATPIPRTLHFSMVGLRDISSLTTAPQDRRSIVTEVTAYDPQRVLLAIQRELAREGQIYYVHNRVDDIKEVAERLQNLVPGARIVVGHGQMTEEELEDVMMRFIHHDADILVSTTIIESGLDIPNANTMIIENADMFGLSQLHQLRGRVGRYKHRAYCYLLLPPDRPVTPVAAKRLKAIEEYSHLGAGFKIAMRDLEIRGAGNILGPEQSGHISAVGYELYCQLLEEAVTQLKTGSKPIRPEAHVELGVAAFIPKTYIAADKQRMDMYRRVSRCNSVEQVKELQKDMHDAFGEPPRTVLLLLALTEARLLSGFFGIDSILKKDPDVVFKVADATRAQKALTGAPGRLSVIDPQTVYLRMPATFMESDACLLTLRNLMMKAYDKEPKPDPVVEEAETTSLVRQQMAEAGASS